MREKSIVIVLAVLGPSIILRALAMDIFLPCVPEVAAYYNVSFAVSQWVLSSFFLGAGLGQLFLGPWSDRIGRRPVLLLSTITIVIISFICPQLDSIYELIIARFIQGLGVCGTSVTTMAIIRDLYPNKALPKVFSYYNAIVALAPLLAPLLGGYLLLHTHAWEATFYFVAVFSLFALFVNYAWVRETNSEIGKQSASASRDPGILRNYLAILQDPMFRNYSICAIMGFSALFMFFSTSSILIIDVLGKSPSQYGYYFALDAAIFMLGNNLSPWAQDKLGVVQTVILGSVLILFGGISMALLNLLLGLSLWGFIIPNLSAALGNGLLVGPCTAGVLQHYKHHAGIASATYGALFYGVSSLLVAAIMQIKFHSAMMPGIAIASMGLISMLISRKILRN